MRRPRSTWILRGVAPLLVVLGGAAEPSPKPLASWATGPFEVRIAFDRALPAAVDAALVGRPISFGQPATAGDPKASERADRGGRLLVAAVRRADAGKTLVLTTDPHPVDATYHLEIPGVGGVGPIRVDYDLRGAEARWSSEGGSDEAAGWWPTPRPEAALAAFAKAGRDADLRARLAKPGAFEIATMVVAPASARRLEVASPSATEVTLAGEEPVEKPAKGTIVFKVDPAAGPALLLLKLGTVAGAGVPPLTVRALDAKGQPLPIGPEAYRLPWIPPRPVASAALADVPDLKGGDPKKGAIVFASADAKCATCHKFRGVGGVVGPDLSDQVARSPAAVYRDIFAPSDRIHPDYLSYTVALKDGRILAGTVRAEGADAIKVADLDAKTTVVPRSEIEEFRPSTASVMPVGLIGAIGEAKVRDLIAYLTSPTP